MGKSQQKIQQYVRSVVKSSSYYNCHQNS